MSKRIKVAMAVLAASFAIGAVAPAASAERNTVGGALNQTLYQTFHSRAVRALP